MYWSGSINVVANQRHNNIIIISFHYGSVTVSKIFLNTYLFSSNTRKRSCHLYKVFSIRIHFQILFPSDILLKNKWIFIGVY